MYCLISFKPVLQICIHKRLQRFLCSLHMLQCRFNKSKWESPICASPPLIPGPGGYIGLIVAPFSFPYLFVFTQCRGQGSSQVTSGRSNSHRPRWASVIRALLLLLPAWGTSRSPSEGQGGREEEQLLMGNHSPVPMDDQRPSVLLRGCAAASLMGMMGGLVQTYYRICLVSHGCLSFLFLFVCYHHFHD